MGKAEQMAKASNIMEAVKRGRLATAQLRDQCTEAIRKGPDLNGIAERRRIPTGGVHGREYMKLVRDDVRESRVETALAKGKAAQLPGFHQLLDEEQKMIAMGKNPDDVKLLGMSAEQAAATQQLKLANKAHNDDDDGDEEERAGGSSSSGSGSGSDSGSDSESESRSKKKKSKKESKKDKKRRKELERELEKERKKQKKLKKKAKKEKKEKKEKKKSKKKRKRDDSSDDSDSESSDSEEVRYDVISGKPIKLKRQKSKMDDKLEYNRSKTLKLLNSAYDG